MKYAYLLFIIIIFSGLFILYWVNLREETYLVCNNGFTYKNFCGTSNRINSSNSVEGKKVFNAYCASCHKLDKNMTGPALRNISQNYDSLLLKKYIRGYKGLIESKGYNSECLNFEALTEKQISDVLKYTN